MRLTAPLTRPLAAREGYRRWAASYGDENPVTALDAAAVRQLTPPLAGKALLDAGCGTGSRLAALDGDRPERAVGVDLVREMVRRGREIAPGLRLAVGDVRSLPCESGGFDVVWCRLVVGYVSELRAAYAELGRVTRPGGCVIVTDFHPAAVRARLARSCWDERGRAHVLEHHTHEPEDHRMAAARAGLFLDLSLDLAVGPDVQPFYAAAGMIDRYEEQRGLPLVLALRFAK